MGRKLLILLIAVFVILVSGCNIDDTVAVVNDAEIHKDELDKQMVLTELTFKMNETVIPQGNDYNDLKLQALNNMIEDRILVDLADNLSLNANKESIKTQSQKIIAGIVEYFGSEEAYKNYLKERKLEIDIFNEYISKLCGTKEMILSLYQQLTRDVEVSDGEVKEYYNDNSLYYSNSTISVVDIKTRDKHSVDKLYNKIKDESVQVKGLLQYTEDMDNFKGSDLKELYYSDSSKAFSDAVFNMEIGDISQPLNLEDGYHVLGVYDKNIQDPLAYDIVKDTVKQDLLKQKKADIYVNYVNENKINYMTKIYAKKL